MANISRNDGRYERNESYRYQTVETAKERPLLSSVDVTLPNIDIARQTKRLRLNRAEKSLLLVAVIICGLIIVSQVFLHYNNIRTLQAIENYTAKTSQLQQQTSQINEEIAKQFNYERIKQVAIEEGMTLDKSRIRNVGE